MPTIAAISTPRATGGISVIRISGENAIEIAGQVFTPVSPKTAVAEMGGYSCAYGVISDNGERVDDGVLTVFRAPKSYTGENVAEISCHGGIFVTEKILRLILSKGAEAAGAGEFTKRAFLNGKTTLTQAEAVMDMIAAEGEASRKSAAALMEGALFRRIRKTADELALILSGLAAWADYPEEALPEIEDQALISALKKAESELSDILAQYDNGRLLREGVDTVICGKPNVGKSSLMNLLSGCERSIVTEIAGTTRDIIEETVRIGGITLRLCDTAGMREAADIAEAIGVRKAAQKMESSALILAVFDNSESLSPEDKILIERCAGKRCIALINKSDKPPKLNRSYITEKFTETVTISAKLGEGLEELRSALERLFKLDACMGMFDAGVIANERQRLCADRALSTLREAIAALSSGIPLDAVTVIIEEAEGALLELTGERVSDVVINNVFSRFCVGK
ncbi:MAG: tRNA uridine-5-carboxymethylaminomethyl(34) synthesis GTPase MnmE [Oscillospiraceae bacterium]|nr:tRNA uridine-5-carboxymethylaminomethyl(34) synthesis GTPase MnmE [Oscillospiraceae bacterium]